MSTIKSWDSSNQLRVDSNSAARVILYAPDGTPLVSQIRGAAKNLRTDGGTEERDGVAILGPGTAGSVILGTAANPFRVDPTGTTPQNISGAVSVTNQPTTLGADLRVFGAAVNGGNPIPVSAVGSVGIVGGVSVNNFPTSQAVTGTVAVSGMVNSNLRLGGSDLSSSNALPVSVQGDLTVADPDIGTSYALAFEVAPVTTVAAGTTYFTLRNNGGRVVYIRRLDIQQGFIGTSAASRSTFDFVRFSGSAPTGGTVLTPVKKNSTASASVSTANQLGTGVTTTGVSFESFPFHRQSSPNQVAVSTTQDVSFGDNTASYLALQPNEGIAIRASAAVVAGCYMTGSIGWHEK